MPLHPEAAGIEDASEINVDWLIDIEALEDMEIDDKSVTMDDASVFSISEKSFFLVNETTLTNKRTFSGMILHYTLHRMQMHFIT